MNRTSSYKRSSLHSGRACAYYFPFAFLHQGLFFTQRNYHATGKKAASLSRPPKIHATQQPSATTQSTPPSSQQPPPTAAASTRSIAASTPGTIGAVSRPNITIRNSGWRTRLMLWVCCVYSEHRQSALEMQSRPQH
jgi:hypothetical protein